VNERHSDRCLAERILEALAHIRQVSFRLPPLPFEPSTLGDFLLELRLDGREDRLYFLVPARLTLLLRVGRGQLWGTLADALQEEEGEVTQRLFQPFQTLACFREPFLAALVNFAAQNRDDGRQVLDPCVNVRLGLIVYLPRGVLQ